MVGGFLAIRFGAKNVLAISILLGALATLCVPLAASNSYFALMGLRLLTGAVHVK